MKSDSPWHAEKDVRLSVTALALVKVRIIGVHATPDRRIQAEVERPGCAHYFDHHTYHNDAFARTRDIRHADEKVARKN